MPFIEVPKPNDKPVLLNCAYGATLAAVELFERNAKKLYFALVSPFNVTVIVDGLVAAAFILTISLVFEAMDEKVTVLDAAVGVTDEIKTQLSETGPDAGTGTVDDPIKLSPLR